MTTKKPVSPVPQARETYIVWAAHEIGKTWDSISDAATVADDAASVNRCDMLIFKLVGTKSPVR